MAHAGPSSDQQRPRRPATGALASFGGRRASLATGALALLLALSGCGAADPERPVAATADGADGAPAGPSPSRSGPSPSRTPTPATDEEQGGTPTSWGPTTGEVERAVGLAAQLSLTDLADQVLMPGFWGYDADAPAEVEAWANDEMHGVGTAGQAWTEHAFGGVFLRPEVIADASQVSLLTASLHAVGDRPLGLPLLVSIDQEGGTVQRLQVGVDAVPSASWVGSTGDPAYAREVARSNAEALRPLGVTMVMAPVADVDPGGVSTLGSRTYSADPAVTARMVVASVEGYLGAGVLPVVKHFPGLGSVSGDSHVQLPRQDKTAAELEAFDLVPFRAAVGAGAPVVMTGHVDVAALDPGVPASASRAVVTGLLRDRLGFEGVAVTDSQGMGPIDQRFGSGEGAVRSLMAGNDLVLNSPRPVEARLAVVRAALSGRLREDRLREAAARVLALRMYSARLLAGATTAP